MKLKQSLLVLSLVVLGVLFAACGGGTGAAVNGVTIDREDFTLGVSQTADLGTNLNVDATGGAAESVTWSSNNEDVATVNENGVVTAVAVGTATITATSTFDPTKSDSVVVTVTTDPVTPAVNSVTINREDFTLGIDQTADLGADLEVVATGDADTSVSWMSSDPNIATVNENGVVTAVAVGTATITATSTFDPTKSDSVVVTVTTDPVTPAVNSVTINETNPMVVVGQAIDLTATVDATGGAETGVTWMSDNEAIATVDPNTGRVTGITEGTATITATSTFDPTKSDSVLVTVVPAGAAETITTRVAQGSDDAEEYRSATGMFVAGRVDIGSSDLELTYEEFESGTQQLVGVRFTNLNIPQGATITNAYIQFTAKPDATGNQAGDVAITIAAQDDVAAPTFADELFNISTRETTTASVSWSPEAWTQGNTYQTSNIAPVVKELVDEAAWNPTSNAIAFIITGTSLDNSFRRAASYSGSTIAARPTLFVTYTVP